MASEVSPFYGVKQEQQAIKAFSIGKPLLQSELIQENFTSWLKVSVTMQENCAWKWICNNEIFANNPISGKNVKQINSSIAKQGIKVSTLT